MNSYGVLAELTDYKVVQQLNLNQSSKNREIVNKARASNLYVYPLKNQLMEVDLYQLKLV